MRVILRSATWHISGSPVLALAREVRSPWERPGGTTFYFVNDGIESALRQAREVAGGRDIRIAGGADTIQQYLSAGLVDGFTVALAPVSFGGGRRMFDGIYCIFRMPYRMFRAAQARSPGGPPRRS